MQRSQFWKSLVHLDEAPIDYVFITATLPANSIEVVEERELPYGWNAGLALDFTKDFGTRWADERRSAVLSVPAVVVPGARNYLINPARPDFGKITVQEPVRLHLDDRLWKRA